MLEKTKYGTRHSKLPSRKMNNLIKKINSFQLLKPRSNVTQFSIEHFALIGDVDSLAQSGGTFDEFTCCFAANNGLIEILQWLRSQDPPCPWDNLSCNVAAMNGDLKTLKWLRSQDPPCPWNERVYSDAFFNKHVETIKWMRSQNPPCPMGGIMSRITVEQACIWWAGGPSPFDGI